MLIDGHSHWKLPEEGEAWLSLIRSGRLTALVNASSEEEWLKLASLKSDLLKSEVNRLKLSFGLHPWAADRGIDFFRGPEGVALKTLLPCYEKAEAIGEIGMDSFWCHCDLSVQRELFIAQLDLAEELGKPVILHTKGQEKEIAHILSSYKMKKLIHWYSEENLSSLNEFIRQDCYFTLGPDWLLHVETTDAISLIPRRRILIETDGLEGLSWALGRRVCVEEVPELLEKTIEALALKWGCSTSEVASQLECNLKDFLAAVVTPAQGRNRTDKSVKTPVVTPAQGRNRTDKSVKTPVVTPAQGRNRTDKSVKTPVITPAQGRNRTDKSVKTPVITPAQGRNRTDKSVKVSVVTPAQGRNRTDKSGKAAVITPAQGEIGQTSR